MDLINLGAKSLTNNDCLLLVVVKAFTFPSAFTLPLKQADDLARQLLQPYQKFGVLKAIRADEACKFNADASQSLCSWLEAKLR